MADENDRKKTKTTLTSALTTVAQPGEKKGSLAAALGGTAVAGPRAAHQVQHVDTKTRTALAAGRGAQGEAGHMAYIIDATGSRSATWEQAQSIQEDMFREAGKAGDLHVRLVHFGGNDVQDRGWFDSASGLTRAMKAVDCESGATQICESLEKILRSEKLPRNIVLIGDSFEESDESLTKAVVELSRRGVKVFAFLDVLHGHDRAAEFAFRKLAATTGGSFQLFGRGMDLKGLCAAVAAYTAGGDDALRKLAATSKEAQAIGGSVLRLAHDDKGPKP